MMFAQVTKSSLIVHIEHPTIDRITLCGRKIIAVGEKLTAANTICKRCAVKHISLNIDEAYITNADKAREDDIRPGTVILSRTGIFGKVVKTVGDRVYVSFGQWEFSKSRKEVTGMIERAEASETVWVGFDAQMDALRAARDAEAAHFEAAEFYQNARLSTLKVGALVVPVTMPIGPIMGEYGYTMHGNTYAVDYFRIHEEMNVKAPITESTPRMSFLNVATRRLTDPKEIEQAFIEFDAMTERNDSAEIENPADFDALTTLKSLITMLSPIAKRAGDAVDVTISGPVRDMNYQAYLDITKAIDEMSRSLAFFDETPDHNCDLSRREVAMSDCRYGCKIYRCDICETDTLIHNPTYGCRNEA